MVGRGAGVLTLALNHPPRTVCKRNCHLVQPTVIVGSLLPVTNTSSPPFLSPLPSGSSNPLTFPFSLLPNPLAPSKVAGGRSRQWRAPTILLLPSPCECVTVPRDLTTGGFVPTQGSLWPCPVLCSEDGLLPGRAESWEGQP